MLETLIETNVSFFHDTDEFFLKFVEVLIVNWVCELFHNDVKSVVNFFLTMHFSFFFFDYSQSSSFIL